MSHLTENRDNKQKYPVQSFFDYLLSFAFLSQEVLLVIPGKWLAFASSSPAIIDGLPCQIGDNTGLTHQSLLPQNVTKPLMAVCIHTLQDWEGTPEAWLYYYHVNTFFDKNEG